MAQACPVNFISVDNTASRIVSALTAAVVIVAVGFNWPWLLGLLLIDLFVRLHGNKRYSPLYRTAATLKALLALPSRPVDSAAKKVAGHFGLVFIGALTAALLLHWDDTATVIALVFIACLLMDVTLDFCVGCKVYHLYRFVTEMRKRSW